MPAVIPPTLAPLGMGGAPMGANPTTLHGVAPKVVSFLLHPHPASPPAAPERALDRLPPSNEPAGGAGAHGAGGVRTAGGRCSSGGGRAKEASGPRGGWPRSRDTRPRRTSEPGGSSA